MKKILVFLCAITMILGLAGFASALPVNPGFETGDLTGWTSGGQAGVQSAIVHDGSYAAWVGHVDFNDDNLNDFTGEAGTQGYTNNWIAQTINVSGMTSLDIWYNYYTWDYTPYDDPGFEIQINSVAVVSLSAGDIDTDPPGQYSLDSSGWLFYSYDLSGYSNSTLDLVVYSGNTGDAGVNSWGYVDIVDPVPEPATMLLLGSGLIGLAGIGRRKRAK